MLASLHWNNSKHNGCPRCCHRRRHRLPAAACFSFPAHEICVAVAAAATAAAALLTDVDVDAYAPATARRHNWRNVVANAALSIPNRSCFEKYIILLGLDYLFAQRCIYNLTETHYLCSQRCIYNLTNTRKTTHTHTK